MALLAVDRDKELGPNQAWMIFSSSWQAWPETWRVPAFSLTTSAFFRYSSLMILLTELSLPGTAEAEMITRSPAWISTCLWVEKAMRKRADMASPWLPVVMMHTLSLAGT